MAKLISEPGYSTGSNEMAERLRGLLAESDYVAFVAEHEGRVPGLAGGSLSRTIEKSGDYARLLVLAVADSGRSLGLGGMIVDRIEEWAVEAGARELS